MKKYIVMAAALVALTACKMDLPTYDGGSGASFVTPEQQFSFVYSGDEATSELVWLDLTLHGDIDTERTVALKQAPAVGDEKAAVAGKHFVAFDDPSMTSYYKIAAGATTARVPVKVLRDASLAENDYVLRVRIASTGTIEGGIAGKDEIAITISDKLLAPLNWTDFIAPTPPQVPPLEQFPFGSYGEEKHKFMIQITGEKWDYDYLVSIGFVETGLFYATYPLTTYNANYDKGYCTYLVTKLRTALAEYNALQETPLKEVNGTVVKF